MVAPNGPASMGDTRANDPVGNVEMIDQAEMGSDASLWPLNLKEILSLIGHVRNHRSVSRRSHRYLPALLSFCLSHWYHM